MEWSSALLWRAIEFHGHKGPFLIVGLRMGLAALRLLDAEGWFDLRCRVCLRPEPPDSCVIDGIQVSTGCTMGKCNIEVVEREGVSAEFSTEMGLLRLRLKKKFLERIHEALGDEEATGALVQELVDAPDEALFDINRIRRDKT